MTRRLAAGLGRRLAAGLVVLGVTACGLPLQHGVVATGPVAGEQRRGGDVQVLPPGPRENASPAEVVRGFLAAQSSPEGGHAIARQFLARGVAWDDSRRVQVYSPTPGALTLEESGGDRRQVRVTAALVGLVDETGSYATTPGQRLDAHYSLRREGARWVLLSVPPGLQLSPADRDGSFRPRSVYFLAPDYGHSTGSHLVADQLFVPVDADPARFLVERLLRGPSSALAGSVRTAVPDGTTLRGVRTGPSGTVDVDLSPTVEALDGPRRQQLSAQLVWTLRSLGADFTRLRLLSDGRPLDVPGAGATQEAAAWSEYDPDGLPPRASAYYVAGHKLRTVDAGAGGPGGRGEGLGALPPVDVAALSPPNGERVGLLTRRPDGLWDLVAGPVRGPLTRRTTRPALQSPSWGSGEVGLWVLQTQPTPAVLLVPPTGEVQEVVVEGLGSLRRLSALRVSRDGVRIALVADGSLYVGRIEGSGSATRVRGLRLASPGLEGVTDVAWESGSSLVVLAHSGQVAGLLPCRVAVDGSSAAPLVRVGQVADPRSLAAAPGRPLVVEARVEGKPVLFKDNGRVFEQQQEVGTAPFYPG